MCRSPPPEMVDKAARLFDAGQDGGTEANMAKMLASEASGMPPTCACRRTAASALPRNMTSSANSRETRLYQVAPISTNLILSHVATHALAACPRASEPVDDYSAWVGRSETREDVAAAAPLAGLAALLDHDISPWAPGTVPPLARWLYFLPIARQSAIGDDGHPRRDGAGLLPPVRSRAACGRAAASSSSHRSRSVRA